MPEVAAQLGTITRFALLLGLTENDIESMHSGLNVDALVEWLQDSDWID